MYLGKFVFLERMDEKDKPDYRNGEYLITDESPSVIYGFNPTDCGYGAYDIHAFPIIGSQKFSVLRFHEDWKRVERIISELEKFVKTPKEDRKWIAQVYAGAESTMNRLISIHSEHVLVPSVFKSSGGPVSQIITVDGIDVRVTVSVEKSKKKPFDMSTMIWNMNGDGPKW